MCRQLFRNGVIFMGKYLNPGNAGFTSIRKGKYIDKTELIAYINHTLGTKQKLTCVSRPRRFGKSFAAQMLCAYYDKNCDSGELFRDMKIAAEPSYQAHLNQYNVLYLDLTWFIATSSSIGDTVQNLQKNVMEELREFYPKEAKAAGNSLPAALADINGRSGAKFIVIIDEWDALFREKKEDNALQEEYVQLLRGLFRSSMTDRMIEAAYMTGILPIKKYGNQSALSDFYEFTMIDPSPLEEFVGFTEEEAHSLCKGANLDFRELQYWYDGYILGDCQHVYSPKSVLDAVSRKRFGSYWTQTETYESLKTYITMNFDGLKDTIIAMLGGAKCEIDPNTFQNDMTTFRSKDDVLTLLVHLGYLAYDTFSECVFIPNQEVREEFLRAIRNTDSPKLIQVVQQSEKLLEATLRMEEEAVAKMLDRIHSEYSSSQFYNNEQSLRAVIQLAYISRVKDYLEFQELPSGKGYADIVFLPKRGSDKPLLVVELKWNKSSAGAIAQIKNKQYAQVVEEYGGEILLIGINYSEKTKKHSCKIEKFRK